MSNVPRCPRLVVLLAGLGVVGSGLACAKVNTGADGSGGAGGGTPAGTGGTSIIRRDGGVGLGGTGVVPDAGIDPNDNLPPITDFPPDPILGTPTTPAGAPGLFGGTPRAGSAPCVLSPQEGTLMPKNWLRPRFEWKIMGGDNLTEIKIQVARFPTPLRIYTNDVSFKLGKDLWDGLRRSVNDEPITVSIRSVMVAGGGTAPQGPSAAAQVTFTIAPVNAPGKIVYWSLTGDGSLGMGALKGFGIGEEGVRDVLVPAQVVNRGTNDGCIGCHSATPGGDGVQFVFGPPASRIGDDTYFNNLADIRMGSEGMLPGYVTADALALIKTLRGIPTFSINHWSDVERLVLLTDPNNHGDLLWVKLNAMVPEPLSGTVARSGDARGAVEPSFSHDGRTVVYVSTPADNQSIHDGRLANGPADLYSVPFNDRAGGTATAIAGASDPGFTEYYPALSPNDDLVAYSRFAGAGNSYNNSSAELFVVPASGGTAYRLAANDPPACLSRTSPGLTNDWSKWAPQASPAANGKTYNWLVFSSTRSGKAQLYVTVVVTQAAAPPQNFPALYLSNQPPAEGNHTPSWDNYNIPPVEIVP